MHRSSLTWFFLFAVVLAHAAPAPAVTIDTVPVGEAGNANDPLTGNLYGGVAYAYRIGATEVTNAQYVDFLNAKAASDPLGLYNPSMNSDVRGGIVRSGVDGSFTYAPKANMADKPVNYVSWYDAIRFANWVGNGQGAGSTETGAYTLGILGAGGVPTSGSTIARNPSATWFLTSESEWYKAAYFQRAAQGGDADDYWLYPTATNSAPTLATASSVGDVSNPGRNVANANLSADWNGRDGNVTTVGTAGPLSTGFFGTSDQGGNVWEWALVSGANRGVRGGSFFVDAINLQSSQRSNGMPTAEFATFGFRVATVPEPGTLVIAALGAIGLLAICVRRTSEVQ